MLPTLYCLADSRDHADKIISKIRSAGVPIERLSALVVPADGQNRPAALSDFEYSDRGSSAEAEKVEAGGAAGSIAGGALGVLIMSIVGLTPLIMIAPLMVTGGMVAGASTGVATAALGSSLADFGIPEAKREGFGKKLVAGNYLIAVRTDDEAELDAASTAMSQAGAKDLGLFRRTKKAPVSATQAA